MQPIDQIVKTDWKFLALVVTIGIVAGGGVWWYINRPQQIPQYEESEVADWQTYRNEEFWFEIKYPKDWKVAKNILSFEPNLVFCPISLAVDPDPEVICKIKQVVKGLKPVYESGMIYLFAPNTDSNNPKDRYLGFDATQKKYYRLYSAENINNSIINQMISTFRFLDVVPTEIQRTPWKTYEFEKITEDFNSIDFMDRRLVGIRDNGEHDVIVPSVRTLIGWDRNFYPRMVSAPSYSSKIFFVKYLSESGHSAGLFELDVKNLTYRKLPNTGEIYENYLNYKSVVSPDGLRIASLGGDSLYVLDLLEDGTKVLVKAQPGEVFFATQEVPDFKWIDDVTIQYPVSSSVDLAVIAIKQISVGR